MLDTIRAAMAREPLRVRLYACAALILASHFGLHGDWLEPAVDLVAITLGTETARAKATPTSKLQPNPPAAGPSAEPQGAQTMDIKQAVANVEAKAKELWAALPPEFQHPAVDALHAAVDDAVNAAANVAEQQTTPDIGAAIDALKAKVQADADARIAQLESVKAVVAQ